jgi:peptide methionine sulfoxide reductase msrA/msrB
MCRFSIFLLFLSFLSTSCGQGDLKYNKLTPEEERIIIEKGTEPPFSGKYYLSQDSGTYLCKRCGAPLFRSDDKFDAGCGWPSFDDEIPGAVKRSTDADGYRTEITCARCGAHLGHVFEGEHLTEKNTRYCVNSISLDFEAATEPVLDTAVFASGCFWGTEYYMQAADGVISTDVGFTGGTTENPTYKQVCTGTTGHAEAVRVIFNPKLTNYETLAKLFFETHDPGQLNRQGPDIGEQYRSAIFYKDEEQKRIAEKLIEILRSKGYEVVTELKPLGTFWLAEDYHQDYYRTKGERPYCHFWQKKF